MPLPDVEDFDPVAVEGLRKLQRKRDWEAEKARVRKQFGMAPETPAPNPQAAQLLSDTPQAGSPPPGAPGYGGPAMPNMQAGGTGMPPMEEQPPAEDPRVAELAKLKADRAAAISRAAPLKAANDLQAQRLELMGRKPGELPTGTAPGSIDPEAVASRRSADYRRFGNSGVILPGGGRFRVKADPNADTPEDIARKEQKNKMVGIGFRGDRNGAGNRSEFIEAPAGSAKRQFIDNLTKDRELAAREAQSAKARENASMGDMSPGAVRHREFETKSALQAYARGRLSDRATMAAAQSGKLPMGAMRQPGSGSQVAHLESIYGRGNVPAEAYNVAAANDAANQRIAGEMQAKSMEDALRRRHEKEMFDASVSEKKRVEAREAAKEFAIETHRNGTPEDEAAAISGHTPPRGMANISDDGRRAPSQTPEQAIEQHVKAVEKAARDGKPHDAQQVAKAIVQSPHPYSRDDINRLTAPGTGVDRDELKNILEDMRQSEAPLMHVPFVGNYIGMLPRSIRKTITNENQLPGKSITEAGRKRQKRIADRLKLFE